MFRRAVAWILGSVSLAILLGGCGAGELGGPHAGAGQADRGSITVEVLWPEEAESSRAVPYAAASVRFSVTMSNGKTRDVLLVRPAATEQVTDLEKGRATLTATAHADPQGRSAVLASATKQIVVVGGPNPSTQLSLRSTVARVRLEPAVTECAVGDEILLTASAVDAEGRLVPTAAERWKWQTDGLAGLLETVHDRSIERSSVRLRAVATGTGSYSCSVSDADGSTHSADGTVNVTPKLVISRPSFPNADGLTLLGTAAVTDGLLRLLPPEDWKRNAAWWTNKLPVARGFETEVQFRLRRTGSTPADGLAFVVQNQSLAAIGGDGQGIGYADYIRPGINQPGIANSLAVEVDVYHNSALSDPSRNHLSIQTNGPAANSADKRHALATAEIGTDLLDGQPHTLFIRYGQGRLETWIDSERLGYLNAPYTFESGGQYVTGEAAPGLELDSGSAWVGLTAASGTYTAVHDVLSWTLSTAP